MRFYHSIFVLLAALFLAGASAGALAEINLPSRPACDPAKMSCTPDEQPKPCTAQNCLINSAAQVKFEKENNCAFPASACGNFDKSTQCCGKDPRTGKPKVVEKVMDQKGVISPGLDSFTWTNYKWACPNMKQNEAPPNALWQQCEKGKKQTPKDDYEITEVRQNGTARPYCIEGCSVPPAGVSWAMTLDIFLVPNRNNPAGYSASSFYDACANHDVCYQTCDKDQGYCDTRLQVDSMTACQKIPVNHSTNVMKAIGGVAMQIPVNTRDKCEDMAQLFFTVLNTWGGGEKAFNLRRQQYCQCC